MIDVLKEEKKQQNENEDLYNENYTTQVLKDELDEKGNTITRIVSVQKSIDSNYKRAYLICIHENGEYTSTNSFKYCTRVCRNDLQIKFDYHALRHTHATILIENGANIKTIQESLGHERIETTLQTYLHNTDKLIDNSVDIFESVVHN